MGHAASIFRVEIVARGIVCVDMWLGRSPLKPTGRGETISPVQASRNAEQENGTFQCYNIDSRHKRKKEL